MTRRSALPGSEWNPVLVVLGVLAALTVLAFMNPWFAIVAIAVLLGVGFVYVLIVTP